MPDNRMSDMIKASLDGIRDFTDVDTVFGKAITTESGVTVIPVSKVTMGIATGGIDYASKKLTTPQNFGGGGGTGMTITPVAFLTISPMAEVNLITLNSAENDIDKISKIIEHSPEIISKIKKLLT
jgi:sporulation protein YtfJ